MNIRHFFGRMASLCLVAGSAWLGAAAVEFSPETISPTNLPEGLYYEDGVYIASADYFRHFEIKWVDSKGKEHTNSILDRATEREHIIALIKEVYTNPLIPGYVEDNSVNLEYTNEDPALQAEVRAEMEARKALGEQFVPYKPCTEAPYNMPADLVIHKPIPGATALLVELKNSYPSWDGVEVKDHGTHTVEDSFDKIRAVTVVPNQTYVGSDERAENPGFIFNLEVSMNKGFIMTKGSIRRVYTKDDDGNEIINENHIGTQPFFNMFEEFSPSNHNTLYGVYAKMRDGEMFPVDHNCSSVMSQSHDMVMVDKNVNTDRAINFRFFLPDWRFRGITSYKPHDPGTGKYQRYSYYTEDHQPYFFFNFIRADVQGFELIGEEQKESYVTLQWNSQAKNLTRSQMEEEFYIYRVINDVVQDTPIPTSELLMVQDGTDVVGEDGRVTRSESTDVTVKIHEPLMDDGRKVTYVVSGRPSSSDFSFVSSNETVAILPGLSSDEVLQLRIKGDPKSAFDIPSLTNHYVNTVSLIDNSVKTDDDEIVNGPTLTYNVLKGKTVPFYLHRINPADGKYERIATFTLDDADGSATKNSEYKSDSGWGVWVFTAPVYYYQPDGVNYLDGVPEGASAIVEMKFDTFKKGDEAPALALDGHFGIMADFVDNFSVSTAADLQPASYEYRIICQPDDNHQLVSNHVPVAVIKRNLYAGYEAYDPDEALNDTDYAARLKESRVGIAVETRTNVNINGYTVFNVDDINDPKQIAFIDRYANGRFEIYVLDENGNIEDNNTNRTTPAGYTGKVTAIMPFGMQPGSRYLLRTEYLNGNTYGNAIVQMPELTVPQFTGLMMQYEKDNEDGTYAYSCVVNWDNPEQYSYRPRPDVEDDDEEQYLNIHGHALWCSVPDGHDPDRAEDFTLVSHHNESADTGNPSRPQKVVSNYANTGSGATIAFNHENKASEETPVMSGHYIRRYTEIPARANISRSTEPGVAVTDNYLTVSIKSTDPNPGMSGVEDIIESAGDDFEQLFDLQGRPVNPSAAPAGVYLKRTASGVQKIYIR
ncbi:MAG: hypothetical protein K2M19_08830 [Muribaculaceae bacterium]|nr:hypothetical protein [Muribaculaceae bacterium]